MSFRTTLLGKYWYENYKDTILKLPVYIYKGKNGHDISFYIIEGKQEHIEKILEVVGVKNFEARLALDEKIINEKHPNYKNWPKLSTDN